MDSKIKKCLFSPSEGEYDEKKSRFIAKCIPIKSEDEAKEEIKKIKKEFFDARHHCFAYIIGSDSKIKKCSDDGEPSNTAGKVILDTLENEKLFNIICIVTRYFGGIKLGTGGLKRAYRDATRDAIEKSEIVSVKKGYLCTLNVDYKDSKSLKKILSDMECHIIEDIYMEKETIKFMIPYDMKIEFLSKIKNLFLTSYIKEIKDIRLYFIRKEKIYIL